MSFPVGACHHLLRTENKMKIGIFCPKNIPISAKRYIANICQQLESYGCTPLFFDKNIPESHSVDLYWDPRAMGGGTPNKHLLQKSVPLVVTIHGASSFALSAKEHYSTFRARLKSRLSKFHNTIGWRRMKKHVSALICVSEYGKNEVSQHLGLPEDRITPIWHGVDHITFNRNVEPFSKDPYFLHISQPQPIKNFTRLLHAYSLLSVNNRPRLIAVLPGYKITQNLPEGVKIVNTRVDHSLLARMYAGALAFVFPSLRESFGMPIIEAMATGCPVITSDGSACKEVAGQAALLVNPRSVNDISEAMKEVWIDNLLRSSLRELGLCRAQKFSWQKSALQHMQVFENVLLIKENGSAGKVT